MQLKAITFAVAILFFAGAMSDSAARIDVDSFLDNFGNEESMSSLLANDDFRINNEASLYYDVPPLNLGAYNPEVCRNQLIPLTWNGTQRVPFRDWPLKIYIGDTVKLMFMLNSTADCPFAYVSFSSFQPRTMDIYLSDTTAPFVRMQTGVFVNVTFYSKLIGFTAAQITIRDPSTPGNKTLYSDCQNKLQSCRFIAAAYFTPTVGDKVYDTMNIIFISCCQINIGLRLTMNHIKAIYKNPLPCIVGVLCHSILMPLLAFAMARIIDVGSPELALGYFFVGIIAGGGLSNLHSTVLGGDFPLSAVMTYITQFTSLGLTPMWLAIFAPIMIPETTKVVLPYDQIAIVLSYWLIPALGGFALRYFLPKYGYFVQRFVSLPFLVIYFFGYYCTYGLYKNAFMFQLFTPTVVLCGCLLPYFGFILAGLIAFACRFPLRAVITIMMETGFNNTIIALYIVQQTFAKNPMIAVLTLVGPYSTLIFSQVPIVAIEVFLICKRRIVPKIRQRIAARRQRQPQQLVEPQDENNLNRSSGTTGDDMSESTRAMQSGSQFDADTEAELSTEEETRRFFERRADYFGKELIR